MSLRQVLDILLYILARIYESFPFRKTPISVKCLVGKTAIVTGGNSGIGYATAVALASRGCKVILADCQNGEESRDQIIATTGNENISYKHLDLSSLQSVRNFAADICRTEEKIDILINNAGIGIARKTVSEDGLNYLMQVNIFGAFLLTHLLLDPLKKSKSAKVLFVSSLLAFVHNLTLDSLNVTDYKMDDEYRRILYANSKVCCILVAREFNKRLVKYGIASNSIDPIGAKTHIQDNLGDYRSSLPRMTFLVLLHLFAQDPQDVAHSYLHVITEKESENSGKNYVLSNIGRIPAILEERQFCEEAWSRMEQLVKLKPEEKICS